MMHAEIFPREDGRYAWRIRATNGQIVCTDGSQGFRDHTDAARAVRAFTESLRHVMTLHGPLRLEYHHENPPEAVNGD